MKFLKINTNNILMVQDFFEKYPDIETYSYEKVMKLYLEQYYWPSNSLETALSSLYSWDCETIISLFDNTDIEADIFFDKWSEKYNQKYNSNNFFDKLLFQILYHNPDILYIQEVWRYPKDFIFKIKHLLKNIIIVGWNCSIPSQYYLSTLTYVDIVYTCASNIDYQMKAFGINSINVGHFFDSKLLKNLTNEKKYDVVFIGSLIDPLHQDRVELLKYLLSVGINVTIFGKSVDETLKAYCKEPKYGLCLYQVYKSSKIVLNNHIIEDIRYSGNIRMYEVTGVGSLLLSDFKEDMNSKFQLDKEAITYRTFEEAGTKIRYYLNHSSQREVIAKNGQVRTLKDYSYTEFAKKVYKSINNLENISIEERYKNILKAKENGNYLFSIQINSFLKKFRETGLRKEKFILYGYGTIGHIIYEQNKDNIEYIIDSNDYVINLHKAKDSKSNIFISVLGREDEIKKLLISHGVNENRIQTVNI